MSCFLPGTQIDIGKKNYGQIDIAESVMDNIFQTGGLMLSQVIAMTSLEGFNGNRKGRQTALVYQRRACR